MILYLSLLSLLVRKKVPMKLADVIEILAQEFGTSNLKEVNKLLKVEPAIKFRISGKELGHFGFTGHIKAVTEEGVKVFTANKVSLIRFSDIETFEKAKPRVERPVRKVSAEPVPKVSPKKAKTPVAAKDTDLELDDEDFESEQDPKKGREKPSGKSGSRFIPSSKK